MSTRSPEIQSLQQQIQRLVALVETLQAENAALRAENAALRAENERLRRILQQRGGDSNNPNSPGPGSGPGSAAPFARRKRQQTKKKPGRKPGEGRFTFRQQPSPTQPEVAVAMPAGCPHCGTAVQPAYERDDVVTITRLPRVEPVVVPYRVPVCRCRECGRHVRGEHADIAADQAGATAHRLGRDVLALAAALRFQFHFTTRKVSRLFKLCFGLDVTHSALVQHAVSAAQPSKPIGRAAADLQASIATAPIVHADDTSWRVTHEPSQQAWVMLFTTGGEGAANPQTTVAQIRPQHRNEEVREVIPADYAGVLVTDRFSSYDAAELAGVRQQKCHAHLVRNIVTALQRQPPGARSFTASLRNRLQDSRALRAAYVAGEIDRATFEQRAGPLRRALSHLLRHRQMNDADNQRLLNSLAPHDKRDSLLRFLEDPSIEPTNNRAERDLRPFVIGRKLSQCSRTWRGAEATARWWTVLATLARRAAPTELVAQLAALLAGGSMPPAAATR